MSRVAIAARLVSRADDLSSRFALAGYFARSAIARVARRPGRSGRRSLRFRLGGTNWEVLESAAHLGGIHDVWIDDEYNAFDGFKARVGDKVLDIGANIGAYSLWQASAPSFGGCVVAVEAAPQTAAVLRANVDRNGLSDRVTVVEAAAWSSSGTVSFAADPRRSSTSSVAEGNPLATSGVVEVTAVSLHDLLMNSSFGEANVDVCKIDVEGAETAVLGGAGREDLRRVGRYVVEIDDSTFPDVKSQLVSAGFEYVGRYKNVVYFARA